MSGIEPGNVRTQPDIRVNRYDPREGAYKPAGRAGGTAQFDAVSIKNYFASLAVNLLARVDNLYGDTSAGSRQSVFEQVVAEASSRVSLSGVFEPPSIYPGGGARKAPAYKDETQETGTRYDFFSAQAEEIVKAHIQAFEGDPFGPEATADRIVNFAVSFFPMFAADNPDLSHEEQVEAYRKLVEGAIDEGFREALQILGALPNEISAGIERTRSLVSEKLDVFFTNLAGEGAEEGRKAASEGTWRDYVKEFFDSFGQRE